MSALNPNQFGVPVPEGTNIIRSGGLGHMEGDTSRSITKMIPISVMKKYTEFNRQGAESQPDSKERINKIANELRNGGVIREPLVLEHNTEHQWGYLGEGHHRLLAAEQAGHTHVPVTVWSTGYGGGIATRKKKGIGAPLTLTKSWSKFPGDTYQPKELHPGHFRELQG